MPSSSESVWVRIRATLAAFFDSKELSQQAEATDDLRTDPIRWIPYIFMHLGCLGVIWVGWSWPAVAVAVALYLSRAFFITGFYHRYFSHKTFRTSRLAQFIFAVCGNTAVQRGPLWWAAQHRKHHAHSDEHEDPHSPHQHGVYWSHFGWLTARANMAQNHALVPDLARYPELRFLDRFEALVPIVLAVSLFGLGFWWNSLFPTAGVSGMQMFVWGFFISTVCLFHATCCINSLAHLAGTRRFATTDTSRNNWFLALMTLGEGWHNNHHYYQAAARQGFYWWEIDISYYLLCLLSWFGIIWDIKPVPTRILEEGRAKPSRHSVAPAASTPARASTS